MGGRSRRGRAAIAGLVLLGAAAGPPPAAAGDPTTGALVLKGSASAYVDVEMPHPFTPRDVDVTVTTRGTYAGYSIYNVEEDLRAGLVSIPAFEETGHPFGPTTFSRQRELPAGTYRIYLLADGPSRVHVPVDGFPQTLRLRPVIPADVDAGVLDLASVPLVDHGAARVPVEIGEGNWIYLSVLQVVDHHQASRMSVCSARRGGHECLVDGSGANGTALVPGASVSTGYFTKFAAGSAPVRPTDLLFKVDGAGMSKALLGFYLVMHP